MPKTVSQLAPSGLFVGFDSAHESPLEPGVLHIPAGCVDAIPPGEFGPDGVFVPAWADDKCPRWNGSAWSIVNKPQPDQPPPVDDPIAKLQAFLVANPDVAAIINQGQPSNV